MKQRYSTYEAEKATLLQFIPDRSGHYVIEIGGFQGATTVRLAEAASRVGKHLVVVDPWNGYYSADEQIYQSFLRNIAPWRQFITVLRTTSQDAVLPQEAFQNACLVFVDGDHDGEAPYDDMVKFWPYVAPGGVLAVHDYFDHRLGANVSAAVDRFVRNLAPPQNLFLLRVYPTDWERRRHRSTRAENIAGLAWIVKDTI